MSNNAIEEYKRRREQEPALSAQQHKARIEAERKADRAERAAVKLAPIGKRPRCQSCDRELRPYRWRGVDRPGRLYGTYGDNRFCGLTCGWRWACSHTQNPIKLPLVIIAAALCIATTAFAHLGDTPEQEKAHFGYTSNPPSTYEPFDVEGNLLPLEQQSMTCFYVWNGWDIYVHFEKNRAVWESWVKADGYPIKQSDIASFIEKYGFVFQDEKRHSDGTHHYWHDAGTFWMDALTNSRWDSILIGDSRYRQCVRDAIN